MIITPENLKELRLDNWILSDKGMPMQVYPELFADIAGEDFVGGKFIALSEEILLKAGFTANDQNKEALSEKWFTRTIHESSYFSEQLYIYILLKSESPHVLAIADGDNVVHVRNVFKHLHQLQNIFFNISGTELTINL